MKIARLIPLLLLSSMIVHADSAGQSGSEARTVIGPRNPELADGAAALRAGDAETGVRLTRRGLATATSKQDRVAGYSNLCAGLIMLERPEEALDACDRALEINDSHWRSYSNRALANIKLERYSQAASDIRRGEELAPDARKLKIVKSIYLDATDPVSPNIIIDDRRQPSEVDEED